MINDGTYRYRVVTLDDRPFVKETFADRPDQGVSYYSQSGIEALVVQDIQSRLPEVMPITASSSWRGMNIFEKMPNEPISVGRFIVDGTKMSSAIQQMHPDYRGQGLWGSKLAPLAWAMVFLVYEAELFQWQIRTTVTPLINFVATAGNKIADIPPEHTGDGSTQVYGQETKEQWQTRVGEAANSFNIE